MDSKRKFINPYNFIPLADQCKKININNRNQDRFSGHIDCTLTTKTALIMLDTNSATKDKNGHPFYHESYKIGDKLAIPGSELRGIVRTKFEELTASCMDSGNMKLPFYGRYNGGNLQRPGLLDLKNNRLIKAKKYYIDLEDEEFKHLEKDLKKYHSGYTVKFDTKIKDKHVRVNKIGDGEYEGILKIGNRLGKIEHHYHIFVPTEEIIKTPDMDLKELYNTLNERYAQLPSNKGTHYTKTNKDLKPVWYEEVLTDENSEKAKRNVYISLGQNGQTEYYNHLEDLINSDFKSCSSNEEICEACLVFGTASAQFKHSSKVRFSDAKIIEKSNNSRSPYLSLNNIKDGFLTLDELSGPKPWNPLFYLNFDLYSEKDIYKKENVNPDNHGVWKGNEDTNDISPAILFDDDIVKIRGRKEYWHFNPDINRLASRSKDGPIPNQNPKAKVKYYRSNRNCSVKPIAKEIQYSFKVFYEDLTMEELKHLNMAISLGKGDYCHKLGLASPLGFGSVKIETNVYQRKIDLDNGKIKHTTIPMLLEDDDDLFKTFNINPDSNLGIAIDRMYSLNYINKNHKGVKVTYPTSTQGKEGFRWFVENRKVRENTVRLPYAYEDEIELEEN